MIIFKLLFANFSLIKPHHANEIKCNRWDDKNLYIFLAVYTQNFKKIQVWIGRRQISFKNQEKRAQIIFLKNQLWCLFKCLLSHQVKDHLLVLKINILTNNKFFFLEGDILDILQDNKILKINAYLFILSLYFIYTSVYT